MDSFLGRLGLYQLLGILFSGSVVIATTNLLGLISYPIKDGNAVEAILFLAVSYLLGMVVQEIGAFIEKKVLKKDFMENFRSNFLNSDVFDNSLELDKLQEIGNKILHKTNASNANFTEEEQEYIFFFCKDYLEVNGKDAKAEGLNSLYAMSRGLMVAFFVIALWYAKSNHLNCNTFVLACLIILATFVYSAIQRYAKSQNPPYPRLQPYAKKYAIAITLFLTAFLLIAFWYSGISYLNFQAVVLAGLVMLTILFYKRARKYARLRVRAIMRHYRMEKVDKIPSSP